MRRSLLLLLFLTTAAPAADCEWLGDTPRKELAALGRWEVAEASAGQCRLAVENERGRSTVKVSRQGFDSSALASGEIAATRKSFSGAAGFELRDEPTLQGFGTLIESPGGEGPIVSVYARRDALMAHAIGGGSAALREDWYRIVRTLAEAALADVEAAQRLASCALLDNARAGELLGPAISVEQPEAGLCVFRSAVGMLQVERQKGAHELVEYITPDGCDSEPLPALDATARVTRNCSNPGKMQVAFAIDQDMVSVHLTLKQPLDDASRQRILAIAHSLRGE